MRLLFAQQSGESDSLSEKLSGLEHAGQRPTADTSATDPEGSDAARAPVNTAHGINTSFDQMELVMELPSNTVTPENRDGSGEFGLSPDLEEVERHRRMNPKNEAMPDDYIYTTKHIFQNHSYCNLPSAKVYKVIPQNRNSQ